MGRPVTQLQAPEFGRRPQLRRPHSAGRKIIGVDGEGWDVDEYGRQIYRMLVAGCEDGRAWSFSPKRRITTQEALEWLMTLPADAHLTSFVFGYDVAHLLMDLPIDRLQRLYHRNSRGQFEGGSQIKPLVWNGWWLDWIPGKQFVVRSRGRSVTIWDAYPFYQKSFLAACEDSGLFTEQELEIVRKGKSRRGDDEEHDEEQEKEYAIQECILLAKLQRHNFDQFERAGVKLNTYYGPGSGAAIQLRRHGVIEAKGDLPPEIDIIARQAYIGGRFEQLGHGYQPRLLERDINSAYPAGTATLPCLAHGDWEYGRGQVPPPGVTLVHVRWEGAGPWGPWPVRTDQWMPHWPYRGHAWVWYREFEAGRKLPDLRYQVLEYWHFSADCDHEPFTFVPETYELRAALKAKKDGLEKVWKLIMNSYYGKIAQSVGAAPFFSPVWAGMVTADCRARLLDMIAPDPENVVATATDAVLLHHDTTHPATSELGGWAAPVKLEDCLLIQPGFYTARRADGDPKGKARTRGIPARFIDWEAFWTLWRDLPQLTRQMSLFDLDDADDTWLSWTVEVHVQRHIGIGLATLWNDIRRLGKWEASSYHIGFYSQKRPRMWWESEGWIRSAPVDANIGRKLPIYDSSVWTSEVRELRGTVADQKWAEWQYDD